MPDLNLVINVAALTFIVDHAIERGTQFDLESGIRSIPVLHPFYIRSILGSNVKSGYTSKVFSTRAYTDLTAAS